MGRLDGKVAIVTGAGRGIGAAIARRFVEEGAQVLLCDLVPDRVDATAAELGDAAAAIAGDVTSQSFGAEVVRAAQERFGGVDVLVNNAGIARWAPFLEHSLEDWERTLEVDLTAVFLMSQHAARAMVEQGRGGAIVSTASSNAHVAEPGVAAYNAAKAGVVLLTKSMAIELGEHGIRANCVCPGHVDSPGLAADGGADTSFLEGLADPIPLKRIGTVDEIANLFVFLASDEAPYLTGESIVIDGGQLARQA
jgi:3-oxoacyl-[acyl-carrier protein] reductase